MPAGDGSDAEGASRRPRSGTEGVGSRRRRWPGAKPCPGEMDPGPKERRRGPEGADSGPDGVRRSTGTIGMGGQRHERRLDSANRPTGRRSVDLSNESRELVAVVVTTDGRRVPVRFRDTIPAGDLAPLAPLSPLAPLDLLRLVGLGLLGLVGLITGSRWEPGGRRGE